MRVNTKIKSKNHHKQLNDAPFLVYRIGEENSTRGDRLILITDEAIGGGLGAVIVTPDSFANTEFGQVAANKTITVFDNQYAKEQVQHAFDEGRLLYVVYR